MLSCFDDLNVIILSLLANLANFENGSGTITLMHIVVNYDDAIRLDQPVGLQADLHSLLEQLHRLMPV